MFNTGNYQLNNRSISVNDRNVKDHKITYCLISPVRVAVISISCEAINGDVTKAGIRCVLTGLSNEGNEISHHTMMRISAHDLKDWEAAINGYLATMN